MRSRCSPAHGPVPVRPMLCGLVGSFPTVTAMLALSGVGPTVGANLTAIVQVEFGDAVGPQVPPVTAKSLAFVPLILSLKGSENRERFVTVRLLVFVGTFVVSVPYASEAAPPSRGWSAPCRAQRCKGSAGRDCRTPSESPTPFPAHPA